MSEEHGSENGSRDPGGLALERHIPDAIPPLVDAISSLYDHAIDRLLLTDERVTSAAEGKKELAGDDDTEVMADQVQRVVVLAVPVVRTLARGARFTRVPWVLVASTAFSIASTLRAESGRSRSSAHSSPTGSSRKPAGPRRPAS